MGKLIPIYFIAIGLLFKYDVFLRFTLANISVIIHSRFTYVIRKPSKNRYKIEIQFPWMNGLNEWDRNESKCMYSFFKT